MNDFNLYKLLNLCYNLLKTMRIKAINNQIDESKKKYFLSYEGIKTEVQYFDGIIKYRKQINLKDDIELIPILRNHIFLGWSNPLKAFERTKFCIDNLKNNRRNIASFVSSVVEFCFYNSNDLSQKEDAVYLYDTIMDFLAEDYKLRKDDNLYFDDVRVEEITKSIEVYIKRNYSINNINKFIKSQFISFNSDIDKVCLIVDRDKRSVNEEQYNQLLKKCNENNYDLFISNPCFEFWLLLHFNEVFDLDRVKLLENEKISDEDKAIHYTENELKKLLPEFEKNNICFDKLINQIKLAIENEKSFEQDINELNYKIGSNVGLLIKDLINN